jgi:starch synthase (maltosyl-transferring)
MNGPVSTSMTQRRTWIHDSPAGSLALPEEGRRRVIVEGVRPEVDAGRFPIKRTVGEDVIVEVDVFADGHDVLSCVLLYRRREDPEWQEVRMKPLVNDRWRGSFRVTTLGRWRYTIMAWVDPFLSWRHDFERRIEEEDIAVALQVGAALIDATAARASGEDARRLQHFAAGLVGNAELTERRELALDPELLRLSERHAERRFVTRYERELEVMVDRERARFGAWYEFFPRSCGPAGSHGTFRDCEERIAYAASLGFDIIYVPPIHPVGRERRKGANNTLVTGPDDPGSPWAIGATEGGHKDVNPQLGTMEDFRWFRDRVLEHGMELALDIAFQCAPDHPYVRQHPEWFRHRPDGSIQYAENPPKKYQDIYPFDFETENWQALWHELESIFAFWADEGVRIFRVDNPHTKPFPFWEWAIASLTEKYPDLIFLSEAFTRPRIMHRLAKLGFSQSYTYYAWRNTKEELTSYLLELTRQPGREYMRPNLWPNTPDILTEYLQYGGRAAFMARITLAATLSASYGIYGPAFELLEHHPRQAGSEEYHDSEKYQLRDWPIDRADSLRHFVARLNRIRRDNPALHHDWNLRFLSIDNPQLIAYAKATPDLSNVILVVVNLDPHHTQSGWIDVPLETLGVDDHLPYQMHDLLREAHYLWHGRRNYVAIDPATGPAHVFRLRRRVRTERDFDYYL